MNILLFSRILIKTGVGNHMKELSAELSNQGNSVWIVSSCCELDLDARVGFIKLPVASKKPLTIIKNLKTLHKIIKDNKIDIVHCHHRMASLYMKIYNIIYDIPVVYTCHLADIPSDYIHRKLSYVGDKAIGVSTEVSNFLTNKLRINQNKVVTILNGVNPPVVSGGYDPLVIKKEWNVPVDRIVIVMNCRIDAVKNHLIIVEAVNHLSKEDQDKIIVVCSGQQIGDYYEVVMKKIHEYGIEDNFIFVGWTEAYKILAIADCLVLPSFNEGFPLNVCEAFHSKVLVARSKTSGFEDQRYCLLISAYEYQATVSLMEDLIHSGVHKYDDLICKAYDFAREELTIHQMTRRTFNIYEEAIKTHKK